MTTAIDIRAAAGVIRAMQRVGADATYRQTPAGVYNPATRSVDEGVAVETSVKAIPPFKNNGFILSGQVKETTFFAPESLLTGVAGDALPSPPVLGDEISIGSKRFAVMEVEPVRSGDDIALYLLRIDEIRAAV
jgi:hypothetical protein